MSDNILSAVLTFSLLAGGTAAIGTEMFNTHRGDKATTEVVTLAPVTIVGHRQLALETVTLPAVTVIGHRSAAATMVAAETQASEPRRVE